MHNHNWCYQNHGPDVDRPRYLEVATMSRFVPPVPFLAFTYLLGCSLLPTTCAQNTNILFSRSIVYGDDFHVSWDDSLFCKRSDAVEDLIASAGPDHSMNVNSMQQVYVQLPRYCKFDRIPQISSRLQLFVIVERFKMGIDCKTSLANNVCVWRSHPSQSQSGSATKASIDN